MKHILFALSAAVLFTATASATVTYSTSGLFNCTSGSYDVNGDSITGCGTAAITLTDGTGSNEAITIAFNPIFPAQSVNASSGTTADYGSIQATCAGVGCSAVTPVAIPAPILTLQIAITETFPDSAANVSAGQASLTGSISDNSSNLTIGSYSSSPVVITNTDMVTYDLEASHVLTSPANGAISGLTTLAMTITDLNVVEGQTPEPATLGLMGAGLVGLSFARRRKNS